MTALSRGGKPLIFGGGRFSPLLRLYLTRLLLPFLFVAGMVAAPFLWLPEVETPALSAREDASKVQKASPCHSVSAGDDDRLRAHSRLGERRRLHALPHHPRADGELAPPLRPLPPTPKAPISTHSRNCIQYAARLRPAVPTPPRIPTSRATVRTPTPAPPSRLTPF